MTPNRLKNHSYLTPCGRQLLQYHLVIAQIGGRRRGLLCLLRHPPMVHIHPRRLPHEPGMPGPQLLDDGRALFSRRRVEELLDELVARADLARQARLQQPQDHLRPLQLLAQPVPVHLHGAQPRVELRDGCMCVIFLG